MKKYTSVLLTVVLLMSLAAGCGTSGSDEEIAGTAGTEADAAQSSAADTSAGPESRERTGSSPRGTGTARNSCFPTFSV